MPKAKKTKEPVSPTIKAYRKWRNAHAALKATEFGAPFVPLGVTVGLNWQSWFPDGANHTPVAVGLIMTIATLALSVLAVSKKDSDFMKKVGPIIPIAFGFLAWGVVCVLLSNVLMELGYALLSSGGGLMASALSDTIDTTYVNERYTYLKQLVEDNGLSKKGEWKQNAQVQAEHDGEVKKAKSVRYHPHD